MFDDTSSVQWLKRLVPFEPRGLIVKASGDNTAFWAVLETMTAVQSLACTVDRCPNSFLASPMVHRLSALKINGELHTTLTHLTSLTSLCVQRQGQLTLGQDWLPHSNNMRVLTVPGEMITTITAVTSQYSNLQSLDLRFAGNFRDIDPRCTSLTKICAGLDFSTTEGLMRNTSQLRQLKYVDTYISDESQALEWMGALVHVSPDIRHLQLDIENSSIDCLEPLTQLTRLSYLGLVTRSTCHLGQDAARYLTKMSGYLRSLTMHVEGSALCEFNGLTLLTGLTKLRIFFDHHMAVRFDCCTHAGLWPALRMLRVSSMPTDPQMNRFLKQVLTVHSINAPLVRPSLRALMAPSACDLRIVGPDTTMAPYLRWSTSFMVEYPDWRHSDLLVVGDTSKQMQAEHSPAKAIQQPSDAQPSFGVYARPLQKTPTWL